MNKFLDYSLRIVKFLVAIILITLAFELLGVFTPNNWVDVLKHVGGLILIGVAFEIEWWKSSETL